VGKIGYLDQNLVRMQMRVDVNGKIYGSTVVHLNS
jgi:hypothetical protein